MPSEIHAKKIRIMLVDDHLLIRIGLTFALSKQPDMEVVAEAEDGGDAIELYRKHRPDVVVLDLRMPKCNGLETIGTLRGAFGKVAVLVLSNYSSGEEIAAALQAGAFGFVSKDTPLPGLLEAIRQVSEGLIFIPPEIARRLVGRTSSHLSSRELEVLGQIGRGLSNKEIGQALNVAEATVKVHVTNILFKLGASDRTQAILFAVKHGIVQLE